MKLNLKKISIVLTILIIVDNARSEEDLWCYQCNADLTEGRKGECNDPYSPVSADLVQCPRNDSYSCIKSLIFYKNVHVTVRGCVPSKDKSTYCSFQEAYPDAKLECLFCSGYGCNSSPPCAGSSSNTFMIVGSIVLAWSMVFDQRLNLL